MSRTVIASLVVAGFVVSSGVALAAGDPDGPRLEGTYEVEYKRKTFDPATWEIDPSCGQGACTSRVDGTDVDGPLRYDKSTQTYLIRNSYKGGQCVADDGEVLLEPSLVYKEKISITKFTGGRNGGAATAARGVVDAVARPTARAKKLGCTNSLTQRTVMKLKLAS